GNLGARQALICAAPRCGGAEPSVRIRERSRDLACVARWRPSRRVRPAVPAPQAGPGIASRTMTPDQALAFAIVIGMIGLLIWDRIRYDLVALAALLAAIAGGIVPPQNAFRGFGDDIVIIVGSALVVSAAVGRSGIA